MTRGYEVDSVIEFPDDIKVVRHGPVFETARDAEWYADLGNAEHIPSWVVSVDVEEVSDARQRTGVHPEPAP